MAMVHHGGESYEVAVSKAAKNFQVKLEEMIHVSVPRIERVIEQVQNDVPNDAIVPAKKMVFAVGNGGVEYLPPGGGPLTLHDHALSQVADRTKVRQFGVVARQLASGARWQQELLAHNLNQLFANMNGDRFLVREVRGQVRGVLSDKFKRYDTRPLLDAFIGAIQQYGARPVDGFALQTKERVRAILPWIFEPFPGEFLAFGAELSNSNYGDGAYTFAQLVLRAWCTNYAISEDILRKVHLGARLPDDLHFSQRTLDLNTRAMASATKDVAHLALGAPAINNYLAMVRTANEQKVDAGEINAWIKKNLTKDEGAKAKELFNSAEIEKLPAGQTAWRFSNAISWLANETENEHRKLDLQDLAGKFILPKAA